MTLEEKAREYTKDIKCQISFIAGADQQAEQDREKAKAVFCYSCRWFLHCEKDKNNCKWLNKFINDYNEF